LTSLTRSWRHLMLWDLFPEDLHLILELFKGAVQEYQGSPFYVPISQLSTRLYSQQMFGRGGFVIGSVLKEQLLEIVDAGYKFRYNDSGNWERSQLNVKSTRIHPFMSNIEHLSPIMSTIALPETGSVPRFWRGQ
jgi:hypothetical protein